MTITNLLRYEWHFLSPKQTFELLIDVRRPIEDRSFVYVAEAVGPDGASLPDVTFNWFFSKSMERSFIYADTVTEPSVHALRALRADQPVHGLFLTVRPWSGADPTEAHSDCWLRTTASGSHAEPGVWSLSKGHRTVEEISQ